MGAFFVERQLAAVVCTTAAAALSRDVELHRPSHPASALLGDGVLSLGSLVGFVTVLGIGLLAIPAVPAIGIIEKLLTEHPDADTRTEDGWWAAVEEHHVALGALLSHAWKLPALVSTAIERHHGEDATPLLEVLRVADQVVRLMDGEPFVPAERLGAIAALSTDQCRDLAAFLPMLPATLDAFREPLADQPASAIDNASSPPATMSSIAPSRMRPRLASWRRRRGVS